jgi:hypothetical protein
MKIIFTIFISLNFLFLEPVHGKVVLNGFKKTDSYTITISDRISKDDLKDFENILVKIQKEHLKLHLSVVQLNSIGGNPFVGIKIGELIRKNHLATYVSPDSKCYSSCVNIFVGGTQRYGFGEIGVHQMSIVEGKEFTYDEAEVAYERYSKEFKAYFEKMRISENLYKLYSDTPFWDFRILTEKEKFGWNINGTDIVETAYLMKEYAKKKNVDREEFEIIFSDNYRACFNRMRNLEMTVWDCAAEKELLDQWDRIYYGAIVRLKRLYSTLHGYAEQLF